MTTTIETIKSVWHRQGRDAAAECLAARSLGDVEQFRRDCAELRAETVTSLHEPVIETARWKFAGMYQTDAPEL